MIAVAQAAQGGHRIGILDHPPGTWLLHPLADQVLRRPFDHPAADRPARVQPVDVILMFRALDAL